MSTAGRAPSAVPRRTLQRIVPAVMAAAALVGACGLARGVAAQGTPAEVTGAQRVFVRRGPGTGFPPFATIPQGTRVEIQDMQGEWARVTTSSGQVGYINSTFLKPAEASAGATPGVMTGAARPAAEGAPIAGAGERTQSLEAEVRKLRQELAEAQSRAAATPVPTVAVPVVTPATDAAVQQMRAELAQLTKAVRDLQHDLNARPVASAEPPLPATDVLDGGARSAAPAAVLLGVAGLLIGWLLGSSHGRKQERGRRSRIRF
jgi:SH3-like domain-containing protein